jgi:hypothetical protein
MGSQYDAIKARVSVDVAARATAVGHNRLPTMSDDVTKNPSQEHSSIADA